MTNEAATKPPEDVLSCEILADAERQAERVRRRAAREAKDIVEKARAENDEESRARLEAAKAEAAQRRSRITATAAVEIGRREAERIDAELLRVHDRVRQWIKDREAFDTRESVISLAAEAIGQMAGEQFVLAVAERDRGAVDAEAAAEIRRRVGREVDVTIEPEPAAIAGGVVVRDAAGHEVWDNSLEARLERLWPALRREVALRTPFGGAPETRGDAS